MIEGSTRKGSAAAKGMAPSVMPMTPMARAARPDSRSRSFQSFGASSVASPRPRGGMQMAAAQAPMTAGLPSRIMATPKKNAVLFTGPPMSKAIMAPRKAPSRTWLPPPRVRRDEASPFISSLMGAPSRKDISPPTISEDRTGMIRMGRMGRRIRWMGSFLTSMTDQPRQEPRHDAAQEARAHGGRDRSAHEAGHQPGPVDHAEGDVARQHRHHQVEGRRADVHQELEDGRLGEVGTDLRLHGRKGDGDGDEDASAGHEGDHVRDAAEQVLLQVSERFAHAGSMEMSDRLVTTRNPGKAGVLSVPFTLSDTTL